MSMTQENLQAFLERETVSDFITMEDCAEIDGIVVYFCRNGYRGFAIEVFPSSFAGLNEHETITSALGFDYPANTAVEITFLPSRNIDKIVEKHKEGHSHPKYLTNPEAAKELIEKNGDWVISHRNKSLLSTPLVDARPRNYRTLVTIVIPPLNKDNEEIRDEEIIKYANITKGKLGTLSAQFMEKDDFLSCFNEMISPQKYGEWDMEHDEHTSIYNQFLSSEDEISFNEQDESIIEHHSRNKDTYYTSVLTTKKYPSKFNIIGTQNLFFDISGRSAKNHLSCPYYVSLKIVIEDKEKLKKIQVSKAQANRYQTNLFGDKIKTYFPKIAEVSEESSDIISRLESKGDVVLKSQFSIVISDSNLNKLHENIESLKSDFEKSGWILQQETEIAMMVYFFSLPMVFEPKYKNASKRFATMLKSNNGAIAPLFAASGSMGTPEKGMMTFDRQCQIQFFDNFEKGRTGNNMVIAAGTRSGKTYMVSNKISQDIACGRKVVFVELDETLSEIADALGGEYIRFDEKDSKKCLNFFTDIKILPNGNIDPESLYLIVPLVGLMINWKLDADESQIKDPNVAVMSSYVLKALRAAFSEAGREAGMAEVYTNLDLIYKELKGLGIDDSRLRDAVTSLEPYAIRGGLYYEFFNGKRNVYFSGSNFIGVGLAALKEKGELFSIVLMALTQAIVSEYYDKSKQDIEKLLYIDEAWALLENPIFVMFLVRIWRTINKYNGAGVAISQDIDQYFSSPELEALYNNSTYKIFFKQSEDVVDRMMRDKKLPEDETLKNSIVSLRTVSGQYSEMMIYTTEGFTINRIITNKFTFYLFTNPDNGPEVFALMKKLNIKKHEAAQILSFKDENDCSMLASVEKFIYERGEIGIDDISEETRKILFPPILELAQEEEEEEEEKVGLVQRFFNSLLS